MIILHFPFPPFLRLLPCVVGLLLCAADWATPQAMNWTQLPAITSPVPNLYSLHFFNKDTGFVCGKSGATPEVGRLYKTENGGNAWTPITLPGTPGPLNDIFFLPNSNFGAVVGDSSYVATTTDRGATWIQQNVIGAWPDGGDINAVFFTNASDGFIVGNAAGSNGPRVARTTNGGATWINVTQTGPANNLYDVDFFTPLRGLFIGTGNPPRKGTTTDGGITWEANATMPPSVGVSLSFYGADAVPGTGTAFVSGGKIAPPWGPFYPEVRKTTDYGATWSQTGLSGTGTGYTNPASDILVLTPQVLLASGQNATLYRSTNGGATWGTETLPAGVGSADLRKFSLSSDGTIYLVGGNSVILSSKTIPNATFSRDTVYFDTLCPGQQKTIYIRIGNNGTDTLTIDSASVLLAQQNWLLFSHKRNGDKVPPGQTDSIAAIVAAAAQTPPGYYEAYLRIYTNDENGTGADTVKEIPLIVFVPERKLAATAGATLLDFGTIRLGQSASRTFDTLLKNLSPCDLQVDSIRFAVGSDFGITTPANGWVLAGWESLRVGVRFAPQSPCGHRDTLLVFHNGAGSPTRVPVVGNATESAFRPTPMDTLDFGSVEILTSASAKLAIGNRKANSCLDTLRFGSFRTAGPNAAEFATPFAVGSPAPSLRPDADTSITFTATPTAAGKRVAYAIFTHDAASSPDTVVLVVRGVMPQLTTVNDEIVFALTPLNTPRDTTAVDFLRNLASTPVTITKSTITGTNPAAFSYTDSATFSIGSKANRSLMAQFRPTVPLPPNGRYEAVLTLETTLTDPITIRLVGISGSEMIGVGGTEVQFAATPANSCRDTLLLRFIRNTGTLPLRIYQLNILPDPSGVAADAVAFAVVAPTIPAEGLVVAPGDSIGVTLRFCPNRLGDLSARLEIASGAEPPAEFVRLRGTGIPNQLTDIDSIGFPATRVGQTSGRSISRFIINRTAQPVRIDSISITGADASGFSALAPSPVVVVAAGGDTSITLQFQPTRRGGHDALLNLFTSVGPVSVRLAGRGTYPLLEVIAADTAPVRQRIGRQRRLAYWVRNVGDDTCTISRIGIATSPSYSNPLLPTIPAMIPPGDSLSFSIDFTPTVLCEQSTTIQLNGEGIQSYYVSADTALPITALGIAPILAHHADTIKFGAVTVGGVRDSAMAALLLNGDTLSVRAICLDATLLDSAIITGSDAGAFAVMDPLQFPTALSAGVALPGVVRCSPLGEGVVRADLYLYFDGNRDSVRHIVLLATGERGLKANLGNGAVIKPRQTVAVPIVFEGDVAALGVDTMELALSYRNSILDARGVAATAAGVTATARAMGHQGRTGTVAITLAGLRQFGTGQAAQIEFFVLMGDSVSTVVRYDSITAPGRIGLRVATTPTTLVYADECGIRSGLVGSGDGLLKVVEGGNPTDQDFIVEYQVPADGPATLAVYSVAGERIAQLAEGQFASGTYRTTFRASNQPPGTYYCVLHLGERREVLEVVVR
ncbi:MAG: choice-of-anchor D domain-containing protein [Armatimonadetes bacterium]|nr:choice-of-anchor D domain-containing protein [Armatimonadota bacterium]